MCTPENQRHLHALDGLRGVAAGAVLLGHATAIIMGADHVIFPRKGLAVQFFFMLSGFVISHAYDVPIKKGMAVKEFFIRRIIRLYPLIIIGTILGASFFVCTLPYFRSDVKAFVSMIVSGMLVIPLDTPGQFPLNPPEWSLFFELIAYVAFGTGILRAGSFRLILIAVFSFVTAAIASIVYPTEEPFHLRIFEASYSFSVGILICRGHRRGIFPSYDMGFFILAAPLLLVCATPMYLGQFVHIFATVILFPLLIIFGASAREKRQTGRIEHFLGEISYPIYILHWPILLAAQSLFFKLVGANGTVVIGCVSTVALSWIILATIDKPFRKWLTNKCFSPANKNLTTVTLS